MTKNRRYEGDHDTLNEGRIAEPTTRPFTLPAQAYGPKPLHWGDTGVEAPGLGVGAVGRPYS